MRRSLLAVALVLVLGALAPLPAQAARRPADAPSAAARAASAGMALAGDDSVALVRERSRGGALSRVRGSISTRGDDLRSRSRDFLERHGGAFGFAGTLATAPAEQLDARRVHLAQSVHGHELVGHGLHLRFDASGERVELAHGAFSGLVLGTPEPTVDARDAVELALLAGGFDPDDLDAPASSRPLARLTSDGVVLYHEVTAVADHRPWALEVDAHDGTLLRVRENVVHGTGTFKFGDTDIEFGTTQGKGGAFKSVKHALAGKAGLTKLPQLSAVDINPLFAPLGSLTGRYTQVLGASGLQIVAPDFLFPFDPTSQLLINGQLVESELFDHVNAYVWLTKMGQFMEGVQGEQFAADYAVPAFVNYDDEGAGYLNAFFSPADPDGAGPYAPGYLLFGEFSGVTGDPMDDFVRDPSIVCHEYAHLAVDKAGASFGDAELDTPSRALNEALADYAAAACLKDPEVGRVLLAHGTEVDWGLDGAESLRDLERLVTLQDDLWDVVGFETGLPQEHAAGNILGAALWRARQELGGKLADPLVFRHLLDLPQSTAETGHPVVDADNASAAWEAYGHAVFGALFDELLAAGGKHAARHAAALTGAFMSHGLVGIEADRVAEFDATEGGLALALEGRFVGGLDTHLLDLRLAAGQQLTLALKGGKGTRVDFALDADPGDGDTPAEILAEKPKKTNKNGTKAAQSKLQVQTTRSYRLTLSNTDSAGGDYKLLVKVK